MDLIEQIAPNVVSEAVGQTEADPAAKLVTDYSDILKAKINAQRLAERAPDLSAKGYGMLSMQDLIQRKHDEQKWAVEELLMCGGMSILAGKPKQGKSTLVRNLAMAVARGEEFLGRSVIQGPVLYLALEEIESEVQRHFKQMGATGAETIFTAFAEHRIDRIEKLASAISDVKPVLVIIDPLFHFVRLKDTNSYTDVNEKLMKVLAVARSTGTHIMLVHHMKKGWGPNDAEQILGSQAFHGIVDAQISLKRIQDQRIISVSQRYAADWPETLLNYDDTTRTFTIGQPRNQAERADKGERILDFIATKGGSSSRTEIMDGVGGKSQDLVNTLTELVTKGELTTSGEGKKGSPVVYSLFGINPPAEPAAAKSNDDDDIQF